MKMENMIQQFIFSVFYGLQFISTKLGEHPVNDLP